MSFFTKGKPDTPITKIDEDLFDVEKYIDALSRFICHCETPMTISIQGDWGSGKTSMMEMVKEKLGNKIIPIWFNTWMFSQFNMDETLALSMLRTMITELPVDPETRSKVKKTIFNIGRTIFTTFAGVVGGDAAADSAKEALAETDETFDTAVVTLKNMFQEAVDKSLINSEADRVVVFVDDLDRLQPERAVELLEIMKLFLDCKNCVFVLAVDYEVVTVGIRRKFGDDIDVTKGKSFFDKIIQLPFKMPVAQYNVERYIGQMMKDSGIDPTNDVLKIYKGLINESIGFNPRSMKRLFNTYQLLSIMAESETDIPLADRQRTLFAIICLQMRYEPLYSYIAKSIVGAPEFIVNLMGDDAHDELKKILIQGRGGRNELSPQEETELNRMLRFMKFFMAALNNDDDPNLSESELNAFSRMMQFSTITSTTVGLDTSSNEDRYETRRRNGEIAKATINRLTERGLKGSNLYRPNTDEKGNLNTSACVYINLEDFVGAPTVLEIWFSSAVKSEEVNVSIVIKSRSKTFGKEFRRILGDNPINLDPPNIKTEGYWYDNIETISFTPEDIDSISEKYISFYNQIKTYFTDE